MAMPDKPEADEIAAAIREHLYPSVRVDVENLRPSDRGPHVGSEMWGTLVLRCDLDRVLELREAFTRVQEALESGAILEGRLSGARLLEPEPIRYEERRTVLRLDVGLRFPRAAG
jgi:hypothetical protein